MRASGATQVISVTINPAPPGGARPVVHQMPVARQPSSAQVLRHRRDDDAIDQLHGSEAQRQEHRRPRLGQTAAAREIALDRIDVARDRAARKFA